MSCLPNKPKQYFLSTGNGTIEFPEFLELIVHTMKSVDLTTEVREAFRLFDKNGDGYITVDELKGILANNGEKISDIELNDMIKDADIDGDGKINYEGNIWDSYNRTIIIQV